MRRVVLRRCCSAGGLSSVPGEGRGEGNVAGVLDGGILSIKLVQPPGLVTAVLVFTHWKEIALCFKYPDWRARCSFIVLR